MKRKHTSVLVAAVLMSCAAPWADSTSSTGQRPHVVVLMMDDLDETLLDTLVGVGLMPQFEHHILARSTWFANSFASNPLCAPSRASFLTGQYTHNHRTLSNNLSNGTLAALDENQTLPVWLGQAGYITGYVGKYLNGIGMLSVFEDKPRLLASWRRHLQTWYPDVAHKFEPGYFPPGWDEWHGLVDTSSYCMFNYIMNHNGRLLAYRIDGAILEGDEVLVPPHGALGEVNYQTDVLAERACEFLERAAGTGQPIFLSLNPLAPHVEACGTYDPTVPVATAFEQQYSLIIRPANRHLQHLAGLRQVAEVTLRAKPSFNEENMWDKPPELRGKISRLPPELQHGLLEQFATRMASMLAVDDTIGILMDALARLGLSDQTLFIFTSDNGFLHGEHRMVGKRFAFEESIRVPLYIREPGQSVDRICNRMVLNNDLAPTIMDVAGAIPGPGWSFDGRSLLPLLDQPDFEPWRKRALFESFLSTWNASGYRAQDLQSYAAVRTHHDDTVPDYTWVSYFPGIQTWDGVYYSRWQILFGQPSAQFIWEQPSIANELYDNVADPFQLQDQTYGLPYNPDRAPIIERRNQLQAYLSRLQGCRGVECEQAEDAE